MVLGVADYFNLSLRLGIFLLLVGCVSTPNFAPEDKIFTMRFETGVRVTAPKGYCLDRKLIKKYRKVVFAVMVPCDDITGTLNPGLFTLTITPTYEGLSFSKKSKLVSSVTSHTQLEPKPQIRFRKIKVVGKMHISGMQNVAWQLIEKRGNYVKILTLHTPKFVKIDETTAKKRLSTLMLQVRHPQDHVEVLEKQNFYIIRPKIRPATDNIKVPAEPIFNILRPRIKPD